MPATKYTYDVANDTLNGKVNLVDIEDEVRVSSIVTAFDRRVTIGGTIDRDVLTGGSLDLWFKDALSGGDQTALSGIVAAHEGNPSVEVTQVEVANTPEVAIGKPVGDVRAYSFSCDFTKKETWYMGSSGVVQDSFNADGTQTVFDLTYGSGNGYAVIDLSHGKVTDEHLIETPSSGSYVPVIKINGAVQTEREMFENSGGHYEIDYVAGKVTFYAAPPSGNTVTVDYYVSPPDHGPVILCGPAAGKKWIIVAAEAQFSKDIEMTDTLLQNVFLNHPIAGPDTPAGPNAEYKTIGSFLDYTYGAFPIVPAFGGSQRGLTKDTLILRWDYLTSIELLSSLEMEMKVWTKHARGFNGERGVVTIYAIEKDE
jgi:hypothetical protein